MCSASLPTADERVCLSGTQIQTNHGITGRLCDCIIIWDINAESRGAVVELKRGDPDASHVEEQLQGGAIFLMNALSGEQLAGFNAVLVLWWRAGRAGSCCIAASKGQLQRSRVSDTPVEEKPSLLSK